MNAEWREIIARHEAGHAVTSIALGWSVRYVTLRPRDRDSAGTTWVRPPPGLIDPIDAGATILAGLAAEQDLTDDRHFMLEGAHSDLLTTRDLARRVVRLRKRNGDVPGVDASWSEWDLGARMWYRACDLVAEHREAIDWTVSALRASSRAVSGKWIRDAVACSPRGSVPAEPEEWWIPRYSRLRWRREVVDAPR